MEGWNLISIKRLYTCLQTQNEWKSDKPSAKQGWHNYMFKNKNFNFTQWTSEILITTN